MHLRDVSKMIKWNLLEKLRHRNEQELKETIQPETDQESETILAEYHETLYLERSAIMRKSTYLEKNKTPSGQRIYRDVNAIEENINGLRKSKATRAPSDLDGRIDRLLASKQKK